MSNKNTFEAEQIAWARIEAETVLRVEMRRRARGKSIDRKRVNSARSFYIRFGVIESEMRGGR